jgi:hypothetical protein
LHGTTSEVNESINMEETNMNRHFMRGAWLLLSLWLALLPMLPGIAENTKQGDSTPDVLQTLGFSALFEKGKEPRNSISQAGSLETILSAYADISLRGVMTLAQQLEEGRWYFTGDNALKDRRALLLRYDMKTRLLQLELTTDAGKAVWPDVLTPQLACTTPVFTDGTFVSSAPQEILNRVDSVQLVYEEVAPEDVRAYMDLLSQTGYAPVNTEDKSTEYAHGFSFVRLDYHAREKLLDITVGQYLVFFVPLPPWPDPLPEQLKRLLPTMPAKRNIDIAASGYLAAVMDLPLFALYSFVHSAQQHYGWSALQDDAVMTHSEPTLRLEFLAWNTDTHRLLFLLEGDAAVLFPAPVP